MGLYFGYFPAWLRPLENMRQTLPAGVIDGLSEETKTLLGQLPDGFTAHFYGRRIPCTCERVMISTKTAVKMILSIPFSN